MYPIQTLQPNYLAGLIQHQKPVILYFKNGYKRTGTISGMTSEAVFVKDSITQVFYKKMINAIVPVRHKA